MQNQNFQLAREREIRGIEKKERKEKNLIRKLERTHVMLSKISHHFSLTKTCIDIDRQQTITPNEFDKNYEEFQERMSELTMTADLYFPQISEKVYKLAGLMNNYWGNYRLVLFQISAGETIRPAEDPYQEVVKTGKNIGSCIANIKDGINNLSKEFNIPLKGT